MKAALRMELQRRLLEEIREFERVTGEHVVGLEAETFEHPQVGRKVTRIEVRVGEAREGRDPAL